MSEPLTEVEHKVLQAMSDLKRRLGRAPKLDEITEECGYDSDGSVRAAQLRLIKKGALTPRQIIPMAITEKGKRWLR